MLVHRAAHRVALHHSMCHRMWHHMYHLRLGGGQALLLKRSDFSRQFFVSIFCKKSFDIVLRNDYELVVQMSGNTPQKYLEEKKKKKIPENAPKSTKVPQNQQKWLRGALKDV